MKRNASMRVLGVRSYRLLLALAILVLSASVTVCIYFGREAALGCLVWSTAAALVISLFTSSIDSILEDLRNTEAKEERERFVKGSEN